ncbi:voltage-gated chloride channel protein (ClC-type) [Legionella beliardensis]|uniref:Voltage-gated chloride channel protein (ClC-type) n=1 Tax=Legionella beliardensis TaxID=91822 RepID=A0A378I285_9GAMM|nr:H(+)/Cl(-) exchange transporter ClcA [Legionella beliardensis]STX29289.1 voltage-gated chloride channel protein (ClC-type) [Legionella beliardensis]
MANKILIIYAISILLGILVGIVGSVFQLAIEGANYLLAHIIHYASAFHIPPQLTSALLSMTLVVLALFLVKRFAPEAGGSGIQEIEGALLHERPIYWRRLLPVKFIGGVFAISSRLLVGREGPTIQMGGNLGDMLGDLMHIKQDKRDTLVAAGAAAGLATAFNAPLAGVLFVLEEMRNQFNFSFTNFKMVAICCVAATITLRFILGSDPAIPMDVFSTPSLASLGFFFLLGIIVGFVGLLFNKVLMFSLSLVDNLKTSAHFIYAAVIGALVGFLAVSHLPLVGGGYVIIEQSLHIFPTFPVLISLIIWRFMGTMVSYMTGVPGGVFAPLLALGTLLGLACFELFIRLAPDLGIHPGMFAVAGMGALFSAAVRAPITGIVLIVEMTQNYLLILPLMVACLTATTIVQLANNPPIYTQLLERTLRKQQEMAAP